MANKKIRKVLGKVIRVPSKKTGARIAKQIKKIIGLKEKKELLPMFLLKMKKDIDTGNHTLGKKYLQ